MNSQNEHNHLIEKIARECHIEIGKTTLDTWKMRVVYSACGRMALASLWDVEDAGENKSETGKSFQTVSITHFKRHLVNLLCGWLVIHPEIQKCFAVDEKIQLEDEECINTEEENEEWSVWPLEIRNIAQKIADNIYTIYLKTGAFYHQPYHLSPAIKKVAKWQNIAFLRGFSPKEKIRMSGLGAWQEITPTVDSPDELFAMFQIPNETLVEHWEQVKNAIKEWKEFQLKHKIEYLRLSPKYNEKYWKDEPDKNVISLLRYKENPSSIYYYQLYKSDKMGTYTVANVMPYEVQGGEYRRLALGMMLQSERFRCISFNKKNALVYVKIHYLPPPAELNFLRLYGWPVNSFEYYFHEKVFDAIRRAFEKIGYQFEEEK